MSMNWVITRDLINQENTGPAYSHLPDSAPTPCNEVGKTRSCERVVDPDQLKKLANSLPMHFRLLDDDGEVYFYGRCQDLGQFCADEAFSPLDMIGAGYGCTEMQYRKIGETKWETL